jgi:uncharacterized GH25 family protein
MHWRNHLGYLVMLATLSLRLAAHDYWFEPAPLTAGPGDTVALHLYVGENLKVDEEREYARARTAKAELITAAGRQDLRAAQEDGAKPFAQIKLAAAGTQLVAVQRAPATITLAADKFTEYLREEGLEAIVAERARRGEAQREGRERYTRYLKCYLRAGRQPEAVIPSVELRLNLVPDLPLDRALQAGDALPVRVIFDGAPLRHAAVFAAGRDSGGQVQVQSLTTDDEGRVVVRLANAGLWVVRLVHMQRAPDGDAAADWESFWGACTLVVP